MDIRKANLIDLELLLDNRIDFVCSIANIDNKEEFRFHTREYFKKHLERDSLISFVAIDKGTLVASCILCIYETLPNPSCLSGKAGLLLNVYTLEKYRRQGLANELLTKLIEEAKQLGVGKIQLGYTDDGYELYKKIGFKELNRQMELHLF